MDFPTVSAVWSLWRDGNSSASSNVQQSISYKTKYHNYNMEAVKKQETTYWGL